LTHLRGLEITGLTEEDMPVGLPFPLFFNLHSITSNLANEKEFEKVLIYLRENLKVDFLGIKYIHHYI